MTYFTSHTGSLAKRLGFGILFYRLFHRPRQFLQRWHQDGLSSMVELALAKQQMEKTATHLMPLAPRSGEPLEVYYLSGRKFWYQTIFCFYSLALQTDLNLQLVVVDDGTLSIRYQNLIRQICPTVRFVLASEIQKRLDHALPTAKYPTLRARREAYPNLRKLTDIHAGNTGWKLVLDSDMLFFQPPVALLNWLKQPQTPCHMVDVETAYGYSPELMHQLAGVPIPERINVGITGLKSDALDWEELEHWCRTQMEQEGTHYYQEQALIAMLMARQNCCTMAEQDYIVMPAEAEVLHPQAQLHHYVAGSKSLYFHYAWKHIKPS